jgi:CubicO group peptidase (beta-lactamase class C family)
MNSKVWISNSPAGCLRLNARDFAKLGMLYLNNGNWQGRSVLPVTWVAASFEPRVTTSMPIKYDYGLHWFLPGYQSRGQALKTAMAQGNGGQCLLIFPEHRLLIVTQAGYYNDFIKFVMLPHQLTQKYILPAVGIPDAHLARSH